MNRTGRARARNQRRRITNTRARHMVSRTSCNGESSGKGRAHNTFPLSLSLESNDRAYRSRGEKRKSHLFYSSRWQANERASASKEELIETAHIDRAIWPCSAVAKANIPLFIRAVQRSNGGLSLSLLYTTWRLSMLSVSTSKRSALMLRWVRFWSSSFFELLTATSTRVYVYIYICTHCITYY